MAKQRQKKFSIDREINDTDIWVIEVIGLPYIYVGGITDLKRIFNNQDKDFKCKVNGKFIDKRGDKYEKYDSTTSNFNS